MFVAVLEVWMMFLEALMIPCARLPGSLTTHCALLSAPAGDGATAGFGCLGTNVRSSFAVADGGFRLCQETEEKAKYFGQQFIELWAEYLKFNFSVGNRLK